MPASTWLLRSLSPPNLDVADSLVRSDRDRTADEESQDSPTGHPTLGEWNRHSDVIRPCGPGKTTGATAPPARMSSGRIPVTTDDHIGDRPFGIPMDARGTPTIEGNVFEWDVIARTRRPQVFARSLLTASVRSG